MISVLERRRCAPVAMQFTPKYDVGYAEPNSQQRIARTATCAKASVDDETAALARIETMWNKEYAELSPDPRQSLNKDAEISFEGLNYWDVLAEGVDGRGSRSGLPANVILPPHEGVDENVAGHRIRLLKKLEERHINETILRSEPPGHKS